MTSPGDSPRVAVLGLGPIGQVHARVMHSLGAELAAVLTSGRKSAETAAAWVAETLGLAVTPCWSTDQLFDLPLDAVVISTPPSLHLSQILQAFDHRLPVLCEKPLLWEPHYTVDDVLQGLDAIQRHPHRSLFVNTSNTVLLEAVRDRLPPLDQIERFHFAFHTQGRYRGVGIAEDLLPHALSLLLLLFGEEPIHELRWQNGSHEFGCSFKYGARDVELDFREHESGPKALEFAVNDLRFERIQEGQGSTYRVFLRDTRTGERIAAKDPFVVYASSFLEFCRSAPESRHEDDFVAAASNARLMAQVIETVRGASR